VKVPCNNNQQVCETVKTSQSIDKAV
jgi:hypothetical protein